MPDVMHTDSLGAASKAARGLREAGIFGQVKIIQKRPYDDIGVRQLKYSVWVTDDQGGTAAAVINALFRKRRK